MQPSERELAALDVLADAIAARVVDRLRAGELPGMVDQAQSGLGRRRHIAFARRLIAAGDARAVQLGRRFLLDTSAVTEARAHYSTKASKRRRADDCSGDDQLAAELGLTRRPTRAA